MCVPKYAISTAIDRHRERGTLRLPFFFFCRSLLRNILQPDKDASVRVFHCRQSDYSKGEEWEVLITKKKTFFGNYMRWWMLTKFIVGIVLQYMLDKPLYYTA